VPSPATELRLRPLRDSDEDAVRAANVELAPAFDFALGLDPDVTWSAYRQVKIDAHLGVNVPDGKVPASFLIGDLDGQVVGRVSVRHKLNDWLFREGGHIGYAVRPAFRRRGLATELLRQGLIIARAHGVDRVLVNCDDDNVGSVTVIERCGGRREPAPHWPGRPMPPKRRYWID
jgi:predicted acetyltransferase